MVEQRKGFWSRLFGGGQGGCCNVRIEEIPEEGQTEVKPAARESCCCGPTAGASGDEAKPGDRKTQN
ncbi:MAG: hypothetical protein H5U00_05550 [Clostridia bacterium]|nr:hypothetical protein [Clostridia bacterium]